MVQIKSTFRCKQESMEVEGLNSSLDDIIRRKSSGGGKARAGPARNTSSNRARRNDLNSPYDDSARPRRSTSHASASSAVGPVVGHGSSIKFLVSNDVAGIVIGEGGANIKKFNEVTDCQTVISPSSQLFPGTKHRVIQLTAQQSAKVANAAAIIWEVCILRSVSHFFPSHVHTFRLLLLRTTWRTCPERTSFGNQLDPLRMSSIARKFRSAS